MKKIFVNTIFIILMTLAIIFVAGCKTMPVEEPEEITYEPIVLSRKIADIGFLTADQLADFFVLNNDNYDYDFLIEFASYYIDEGLEEGINSDVAFAQMCLETGFLRFGGLVQEEWNNFKEKTHTHSDYFIESIMKGGKDNE